MNAHTVKIEWEEDGCWLVLTLDEIVSAEQYEDGSIRFRLEDPEGLANAVRADILPWLRERDEALATYRTDPASPGFAGVEETLADVGHKHPDWYSVHVDHYDNREKV